MERVLAGALPRSTSAATARQFMEKEGFVCTLEKEESLQNGRLSSQDKGLSFQNEGPSLQDKDILHRPINYLSCEREDRGFPVLVRWKVKIVLNSQDFVDEIQAKAIFTGP